MIFVVRQATGHSTLGDARQRDRRTQIVAQLLFPIDQRVGSRALRTRRELVLEVLARVSSRARYSEPVKPPKARTEPMPPDATLDLLLNGEEEALPMVQKGPGLAGFDTAAAGPRGEEEADQRDVGRGNVAAGFDAVRRGREVGSAAPIDLAFKQA